MTEEQIDSLEVFLRNIESGLSKPLRIATKEGVMEFRYGSPKHLHFIFLSSLKIISNIKACKVLIEGGHLIETCALLRVLYENSTRLDFYVSGIDSNYDCDEESEKIVKDFFDDFKRPSELKYKYPKYEKMRKKISRSLGQKIAMVSEINKREIPFNESESAERMKFQYEFLGNFVHGKYPETMMMFHPGTGEFQLLLDSDSAKFHVLEPYFREYVMHSIHSIKMSFISYYGKKVLKLPFSIRAWLLEEVF